MFFDVCFGQIFVQEFDDDENQWYRESSAFEIKYSNIVEIVQS